jgi:hypothetical protein
MYSDGYDTGLSFIYMIHDSLFFNLWLFFLPNTSCTDSQNVPLCAAARCPTHTAHTPLHPTAPPGRAFALASAPPNSQFACAQAALRLTRSRGLPRKMQMRN